MATSAEALAFVLANEGGMANLPQDSGGLTNRGLSLRFLQGLAPVTLKQFDIPFPVTANVLDDLTIPQIDALYITQIWDKGGYALLSSQRLANYVFDMGVSMGIATGNKIAQRAYNSLVGENSYLLVDGILGAFTAAAINATPVVQMVNALPLYRAKMYKTIVQNNPDDKAFINGWLARCNRI